VRLGVVGPQPQRLLVAVDCLAELAQLLEDDPDVVIRLRVGRPQPQRLAEGLEGLVEPALVPQGVAQVVVRVGVAGANPDRLAVAGLGLGEPAEPRQHDAQLVVDLEVVGADPQHLPERRHRRFELPPLQPEDAEALGRLEEPRRGPQRGLEGRRGLVELRLPAQDAGQVIVGLRAVGPACDGLPEARDRRVERAGGGKQIAQLVVKLDVVGAEPERRAVALGGPAGLAQAAVRRGQAGMVVRVLSVEPDRPAQQVDRRLVPPLPERHQPEDEQDVRVVGTPHRVERGPSRRDRLAPRAVRTGHQHVRLLSHRGCLPENRAIRVLVVVRCRSSGGSFEG
jgi:hypothetical protein